MIYLNEETSSQENMEAWLSQLSDPEFPLLKDSVLKLLKPRLVACNFEEKSAEFAFTVEDWQLNPEKGFTAALWQQTLMCPLVCCPIISQNSIWFPQ